MLIRISVALFALYLAHGSENVARDGARLAQEVRSETPAKAAKLCLDNPETCIALASHAGRHVTGSTTPARAPTLSAVAPSLQPLPAGENFPLPPRRPAPVQGRKGA